MGFGFNFALIFLIFPLSALLLVIWGLTRKSIFVKLLLGIWVGIVLLILVVTISEFFTRKTILEKEDYYGEYIIDRNYFKGEQADWQYNSFRFEIKPNDSIYFYVTDQRKILKTYEGTIETVTPYGSARLVVNMEEPTHHVFSRNPTTYRAVWSFYLVFNSPKYYNMFFRKGKWKEITK